MHVQLREKRVTIFGVEKIREDFDGFELEEEKRLHERQEKMMMSDVGRVTRLPMKRQFHQRSVTFSRVPRGIDFSAERWRNNGSYQKREKAP